MPDEVRAKLHKSPVCFCVTVVMPPVLAHLQRHTNCQAGVKKIERLERELKPKPEPQPKAATVPRVRSERDTGVASKRGRPKRKPVLTE